MKSTGIWLDKKRAVIVRLDGEQEELTHLESDFESRHRATHGAPAPTKYGAQYDAEERKKREQDERSLSRFYQDVADAAKGSESIYVMGPGVAKTHVVKLLESVGGASIPKVTVEAADQMPDKQIVLKVREAFNIKPPRMTPR